MSYSIC